MASLKLSYDIVKIRGSFPVLELFLVIVLCPFSVYPPCVNQSDWSDLVVCGVAGLAFGAGFWFQGRIGVMNSCQRYSASVYNHGMTTCYSGVDKVSPASPRYTSAN